MPLLDGELIVTNYKLVFKPATKSETHPAFLSDFLTVTLGLIIRAEKKVIETKKGQQKYYNAWIEVQTKDHRYLRLDFEHNVDDCTNTHSRLFLLAFPEHPMGQSFAFQFSFPAQNVQKEYVENGWGIWNPDREFLTD